MNRLSPLAIWAAGTVAIVVALVLIGTGIWR